jgi:hypothetical protein
VPIDFRLDGVRQVYGTARTKAARKEDSKVFTSFSVAPAASRRSPQSAAPHRALASSPFELQNFSVELFHKRAGRLQIRKTPPIIDLAFSNNSPYIPCLNFPRSVKAHNPAVRVCRTKRGQGTEHRSDPSVLGVFFLLTEETEIQAKYEQNEVNDGALAADVGCLNRNGPRVWQHNGK